MNCRKFVRLLLRKTPKTLLITIFVMTYSLMKAHITEEDGGFALTLSRDCFIVPNFGQFSRGETYFNVMYKFSENDYSEKHADSSRGINFTLHTYINGEDIDNVKNNDFGFFYMSQFVIHGYEDAPKYIKSIDIKWSKEDEKDDALWLKAKKDEPSKAVYNKIEEMRDEEFDVEFHPSSDDADENMNQTIIFDKPVHYLILTKTVTSGSTARWIVRFESITVHFTDEDPTVGGGDAIKLSLCDGKDQISMPWTKEAATLENIVGFEADEQWSELEEMDLRFYLTPEFEPAERPDYEGEKIDGMTDWDWYRFSLLERNGRIYDGFLSVERDNENRMECEFDAENNALKLPAVCSGLYRLSVESGNSNVTGNEVLLNIYPDIIHTYSVIETGEDNIQNYINYEFSINGVTFGQSLGSKGTFGYPYADNTDYSKGAFEAEALDIDIPGLYDAELYYRVDFQDKPMQDDGPGDLGKHGLLKVAPDIEGYKHYTEESKPDLTDLTENKEAVLQLKIVKNNAMTPDNEEDGQSVHTLTLKLDASVDIPTAVDTITADYVFSGITRYYNLNGVEVNPRNLPYGIYIKVENGKAEKLVIR